MRTTIISRTNCDTFVYCKHIMLFTVVSLCFYSLREVPQANRDQHLLEPVGSRSLEVAEPIRGVSGGYAPQSHPPLTKIVFNTPPDLTMKSTAYPLLLVLAGTHFSAGANLRADSSRQLDTEFHALKKLLQAHYGNTCTQRTTGRDTSNPITTVQCQQPGGTATMVASGAPPGPTPQTLQVCETGSDMKETCSRIPFHGNAANDLERARELLEGHQPRTFTDYDMLAELLNLDFDNSCKAYTIPGSTQLQCDRPGGSATLFATGNGNTDQAAQPTKLTVCMFGAEMKRTCDSVALNGQKVHDLNAAKQLLNKNLSNDSEYDQILQLLNTTFTGHCTQEINVLPPGPTDYTVTCTIPGGLGVLKAEQSTGETSPVPQNLKVCLEGTRYPSDCESVNFTGNVQADLRKARVILG